MDQPAASLIGVSLDLSLPQREVWLDQLAWPGQAHLNIGGAGVFEGPLDVAVLQETLQQLSDETEALRLVPLPSGGQRLLYHTQAELELVDLSHTEAPNEVMAELLSRSMREPFAWGVRPPWRFRLYRLSPTRHGVLIQFHHAVMDGWGTTQIARRWAEIYSARVLASPLQKPPVDAYQNFIRRSLAYRRSADFDDDRAFWQGQLKTLPEPLIARKYRIGRPTQLPAAEVLTLPLARRDFDALRAYAKSMRVTPFVVIASVLAWYYGTLRARASVMLGVPVANRQNAEERATPGMFVGVLPLWLPLADTWPAMLSAADQSLREALRHARFPLSEMLRDVGAAARARSSLFDVLLSFERQNYSLDFGPVKLVSSRQLFCGVARHPLSVTVCEFGPAQDLELVLEGSLDCFDPAELSWLGQRLLHALGQLCRGEPPSLLPPLEREALQLGRRHDFSDRQAPTPFITQFEHHAAARPNAEALLWPGGRMRYGELDRRATRLAAQLVAAHPHLGPGQRLAIAYERSPDLLITLLAVAKTGAAFVLLDINAPLPRMKGILEECAPQTVVVAPEFRSRLASLPWPLFTPAGEADHPVLPSVAIAPEHLAYVLYTSGSSGTPKGVKVSHGALARRLAWLAKNFEITPEDRAGSSLQITFDAALIELLLPLVCGASLALPGPGRLSPAALARFAADQSVTFLAFVPATLQGFVEANLPGRLRVACCGGETLDPALSNRFLHQTGARLWNVYGPTEATLLATAWAAHPVDEHTPLPIGEPLDDTRIYVLDEHLQPRPFGEPGEIFIGGNALAEGYLQRDELTAASFLPDPFHPGARIYRSGDIGWISGAGQVYFSGRTDRQIKLRGYRIELDEIEAVLLRQAGITRAAVKPVEEAGRSVLHAWVQGQHPDLHAALRAQLPDYMLPAHIETLAEWPHTPSGKTDYHALTPRPRAAAFVPPHTRRAPANDTEAMLLEVWQNTLKRAVALDDNFFEIGGDSLFAIQILAAVEERIGRRIPLFMLIEHPSIEALAAALVQAPPEVPLIMSLSRSSAPHTLHLAASGQGDVMRFSNLARALEGQVETWMLTPPAGRETLDMIGLAELYATGISQGSTPPQILAGFSVGGVAALETARLLAARGVTIQRLVLIDTLFPHTFLHLARAWGVLGGAARLMRLSRWSVNGQRLSALFQDPGLLAQVRALAGYSPAPYSGPVTLIQSSALIGWSRSVFDPWQPVFSHLERATVPGLHGTLFQAENVTALAHTLAGIAALR